MNDERIPAFEGHVVHATAVKMSGAIPMDNLGGVVIGVDDVVQVVAQFKCVNVHHNSNAKGELVRVQVMRPIGMDLEPLVPGKDNGIIRALPQIVRGEIEKTPPVCTCGSEDDGHTGACDLMQAVGLGASLGEGEKVYLTFGTERA